MPAWTHRIPVSPVVPGGSVNGRKEGRKEGRKDWKNDGWGEGMEIEEYKR